MIKKFILTIFIAFASLALGYQSHVNAQTCFEDGEDCVNQGTFTCMPDAEGRSIGANQFPNRPGQCACPTRFLPVMAMERLCVGGGEKYSLEDFKELVFGEEVKPMVLSFDNGNHPWNVIHGVPYRVDRVNGNNRTTLYVGVSSIGGLYDTVDRLNPNYFAVPNSSNVITAGEAPYDIEGRYEIIFYNSTDAFNQTGYVNKNICSELPSSAKAEFTITADLIESSCELVNNVCQKDITNQCGDLLETQECNPDFCCTKISRGPDLIFPINEEEVTSQNINFQWDSISDNEWGNCQGDRKYRLYLAERSGGSCPTTSDLSNWTLLGETNDNKTSLKSSTNPNIQFVEDKFYCWFVRAIKPGSLVWNDTNFKDSAPGVFKVILNPFLMTSKGDFYIGGSFEGDKYIKGLRNPVEFDDSLIIDSYGKIRLETISTSYLNVLSPKLSQNLLLTPVERVNLIGIASTVGFYKNDFFDRSYEEYTLPSDNNPQSVYAYYDNRLRRTATPIIKTIYSPSSNQNNIIENLTNLDSQIQGKRVIKLDTDPNETVNIESDKPIICIGNTIFMIEGDLNIKSDIISSSNLNSSCVFIVDGDISIEPSTDIPDDQNYRIIEALLIGRNINVKSTQEKGAISIHGMVITHNGEGYDASNNSFTNAPTNNHNVFTNELRRPQEFYIYDPRYLMIWSDTLDGNLTNSSIREERFVQLID